MAREESSFLFFGDIYIINAPSAGRFSPRRPVTSGTDAGPPQKDTDGIEVNAQRHRLGKTSGTLIEK